MTINKHNDRAIAKTCSDVAFTTQYVEDVAAYADVIVDAMNEDGREYSLKSSEGCLDGETVLEQICNSEQLTEMWMAVFTERDTAKKFELLNALEEQAVTAMANDFASEEVQAMDLDAEREKGEMQFESKYQFVA